MNNDQLIVLRFNHIIKPVDWFFNTFETLDSSQQTMTSQDDSTLCPDATQHKSSQRGSKTVTNTVFRLNSTNNFKLTFKWTIPTIMSPKIQESENKQQQAKIIVGFPGIGKSTLTQKAAAGKYTRWNVKQILDEPNYMKGNEEAFLAGLVDLAKEPDTVLLLPAHRFVSYFHTPH